MVNAFIRLAVIYLLIAGGLFVVLATTGCVSNSAMLDTTVNDPVMLNLTDWDDDFFGVEDGGGSSGSSMSCYS